MLTRMGGRRTRSTLMTQIWALYRQSGSDRLEKQPTDPATARRHHHYMRDGALVSWGFVFLSAKSQKVLFWLHLEHHAKTRFAAHHAVVSLWSTVQGVFFDHWQHSADLAELKSVFGIDGRATRPAVN